MSVSPGLSRLARSITTCSVAAPAGTITHARRRELRHEVVERRGADRALARELLDNLRVPRPRDDLVAAPHEPPRHVPAHPAQAHHPDLHDVRPPHRVPLSDRLLDGRPQRLEPAPDIGVQMDPQGAAAALDEHLEIPRACAAFTTPNVYACPGTARSAASSHVIWRNTPVFGPPLYACPVECRKRGPKPTHVATR